MASEPAPGSWQEVERLYHAALEQAPGDRQAFLSSACSDADIRREVEVLLQHDDEAGDFLERPAIEDSAATLVTSHRPLSTGDRIGGYEISGFIGAGGMGDVYRARDLRLERDVALKIVDRLAPDEAARFENEARAASGLSHPNVVTIYGVGEDEAVAYIAMELVHGVTLSEQLHAARPGLAECLDLAVQLADALAAAHDAGIVHRDLKPDNIMVTSDGRIKVLDFGIARRARQDDVERGSIRGTAGYMAPEQADGESTDHRTDQFAFGAILYELFSGRRAFQRDTLDETLQAVRTERPEPLDRLNADVPAGVRELIERCLEKAPDDRWPSTHELAAECRRLRDRWLREEDHRQMRRRTWWWTGAAIATVAAGFSIWKAWPSGIRARSIAVLPFLNVDADPAADYLCEGLAESVMRRLAFLPNFEVRPRSAAFNFKGATGSAVEAGRRLRADAVLSGSVRVADGQLRVSARLTDVSGNRELWAENYTRSATDALAVQEDLARAIVSDGIRHPLDAETKRRLERPITTRADANDLYLRAIHLHRLEGEENYLGARQLLQQAVTIDPAFVLAHVSLASTFSVMTVDGYERPTQAWPAANRAVRHALDLDPELPEAHSEQSTSWFFFDHDWTAAESAWKRATGARPSPTLTDLMSASAVKLWALGRTDEALDVARRVRALDGISPQFAVLEADLLLHDRRPGESAAIFESVLASDPQQASARFGVAEAYRRQGRIQAALDALRQAYAAIGRDFPAAIHGNDERAYRAADRAMAEAELDALAARSSTGSYVSPLQCAQARARMNDADGAFRDLDAAIEEASPGLVFLRVDRSWDSVRRDSRFEAVVATVGFP